MTLNLPSKSSPYKERNLSPNQSSWTSPSPTQSNVSFALKANSELDYNSNVAISMPAKARCNACWIKKCIDIYYDISFDDKIMKILQDFRPIQLTNLLDESKSVNFSMQKSGNHLNQSQFNQSNGQNGTLTKQKRYYTNNKFKSKSVSRLYYNNQAEKSSPVKGKTTVVDQSMTSNGLSNRLDAKGEHPTNGRSFNDSVNGSNCSSSINDSGNNSNNELSESNNTSDTSGKNQTSPANGSKSGKPLSNIPIKAKSNGKLNGNTRSNSNTSNASSSTVNLSTSKTSTKSRMSNTITLNNLPFKSNAFNAISNKPNVSKHSTILPNGCNVLSGSAMSDAMPNAEAATSDEKQPDEKQPAKKELTESAEVSPQANQTNGDECGKKDDHEQRTEATDSEDAGTKSGSVCLIFNEHSDQESPQNVNTIEVGDTDKPKAKADSHFFRLSNDNNLNLLYTNIHTMPERV